MERTVVRCRAHLHAMPLRPSSHPWPLWAELSWRRPYSMHLSANHRDRARNASQMEPATGAPLRIVCHQEGFHVGAPGLAAPEGRQARHQQRRRMPYFIPLRPNHFPNPPIIRLMGFQDAPAASVNSTNTARFSVHNLPRRHCGFVGVMIQFADGSFTSAA